LNLTFVTALIGAIDTPGNLGRREATCSAGRNVVVGEGVVRMLSQCITLVGELITMNMIITTATHRLLYNDVITTAILLCDNHLCLSIRIREAAFITGLGSPGVCSCVGTCALLLVAGPTQKKTAQEDTRTNHYDRQNSALYLADSRPMHQLGQSRVNSVVVSTLP
jgi:hypothetical protein